MFCLEGMATMSGNEWCLARQTTLHFFLDEVETRMHERKNWRLLSRNAGSAAETRLQRLHQ